MSPIAVAERIRRLIGDARPEPLEMDFALWTRAAVMVSIEHECYIELSVRGVGNDIRRWDFTPQEPIEPACEQRPEAVEI